MSTSAASKPEWLVVVPDKPNALSTRVSVRDKHLAGLKPNIDAGITVFGGAMMEEHPREGEAPKMKGSAMVLKADSEADLRKILEGDTYTVNGVWDLENIQIYPVNNALA